MINELLKSLNIDPLVLLLNGVLFLVLLAILNAIFWKPMMAHLEKRKQDIEHAYKTVDNTRREMENLRADYQAKLAAIESEARGQIQQTVRDAQHERERLIAEARAQAEQIMQEGQTQIEQEREQTLASMRLTLDAVALNALSRATGAPPDTTQRKLVDEFIKQEIRQ